MNTKNILSAIEANNFLASESEIESLAKEHQESVETGRRATGTYLKILVALTAEKLNGHTALLSRRRGRLAKGLGPEEIAQHLAVLESVNSAAYAAVMRAVITPDIERHDGLSPEEARRRTAERNRRTIYARTSMSTVRAFIEVGRDIRDLDIRTVTKRGLAEITEEYRPPSPAVDTARALRSLERASAAIVGEAEELAYLDPLKATALLESLMDTLQEISDKIKEGDYSPDRTEVIKSGIRDRALAGERQAQRA